MSSDCYLREFDPPGFELDRGSGIGWFDQYYKAFIWDNVTLRSALKMNSDHQGLDGEIRLLEKLNKPFRNIYVLGMIIFDIENGGIDQALYNKSLLFPYFMSALRDIGAHRSEAAFGALLNTLELENTDVRAPLDEWSEVALDAIDNISSIYYNALQDNESISGESLDDELARTIKLFIHANMDCMQIIRKVQ